jgi:copper(I)-binding protein
MTRPPGTGAIFITVPSIVIEWISTWSAPVTVMKMAPVPGGLVIAPGATVTLAPGGYHMMFVDLTAPLKKGERVKGTLRFEKAGTVPVEFAVEAIGAKAPEGAQGAAGGHDHAH